MASRRRALACLVLAAASWGAGTVLSKAAVGEVPPLSLLGAQLVISVLVLAVAVARQRSAIGGLDRRLVALGALNPGVAYGLSLIGLTTISATVSVLVWAVEPILILLLAAAALGERPGWRVAALSAVALGGLVVVLDDPTARLAPLGVIATVAGVGCCAVYSVASRRWIGDAPSTLGIVFAQQLVAAGLVGAALPLAAIVGAPIVPAHLSGSGVASVLASGVLYYGAAYLLYLSALRDLAVSVAAIAFYLVPIFGVAVASASGETLSLVQSIGAATTVGAVLAVGGLELRRSGRASPQAGPGSAARSAR